MILSDSGAFSQIIQYPLGKRPGKPRESGWTMVIDKGLGYEQVSDLLEVASAYIDVLKFGFGTSCLYPRHILRQKLSLARVFSVLSCPGGTLGEIALSQNVYDKYLDRCVKLGFTAIEVSDGTIDLRPDERLRAIASAKKAIPVVISEVGKKLDHTVDIRDYATQVTKDLEAGADFVVIEGRESGENAGIYGAEGQVDTSMLNDFVNLLSAEARAKIIWEAPKKAQQVELIRRFGPTVSLGNIPPTDVIALECLRLGLRADTFALRIREDDR
ncbi:phosphosulfolactate synthase [Alicyclobacillus fastidiosus]|uniref:Phosphosulfolactate synthase n=1 Tax=Alicyclobacillus fastidiosus TaxID=392011 RepID=A0ABY6ZBZ9_9BACL|nr:phosphosulfolactate synthase [Alicyclobacillus fastidiosus]WAH40418.1 phosphosulfolactate synthase [Alicyclobacillus fastidiosus]